MARGWESKSVESQQTEPAPSTRENARKSPEEIDKDRKRASLELSRRRVMHDLESATSDVHRAALENAKAFLDAEIAKLG